MMSYGIVAALAIGLAVLFHVQAADYPNAAAELPQLLAYVVIALAILIVIDRVVRRRGEGGEEGSSWTDRARLGRIAAFSAALIAYVLLLEVAGYVLATGAFLMGCFLATRILSWPKALLVTGGMTLVIYGVFIAFLRLPLDLVPAW